MKLKVVAAETQGKRQYMEDFNIIFENNDYLLTAILDGHGGKSCALFIKNHFVPTFQKYMKKHQNDIKQSLYWTAIELQNIILNTKFTTSGSTCNVIVIDKKTNKVYASNIGDSRAILCDLDGFVHQITKDHSLTDPGEYAMVYRHNGWVENNRVNGILSTSRSFGDINIAKYMSAIPDIYEENNRNIHLIMQSSDGILDVMDNQNICDFIQKNLSKQQNISLEKIAQDLIQYALFEKGAFDNLTIIIILFLYPK